VSQALPVLPQLPVLDGRKPDFRPTAAGDRQTFDRLLDRFTHRDIAKDTVRERTCEAPLEKRPEEGHASPEHREDAPTGDAVAKADPAHETAEPTDLTVVAPAVVPPAAEVPVIVATGVEPPPVPMPVIQPAEAAPVAAVAVPPLPQPPAATADTPKGADNVTPMAVAEAGAVALATPTTAETAARVFAMDGAAAPVAQPQVTRVAASMANAGTMPTTANGQPKPVADAGLARAPSAKTTPAPEGEPADLERQIRLDGKARIAPSAVAADPVAAAAHDGRGAAAKTPEQQFAALIAVETPRHAAAQYHKVAETVRTAAAAAETPSPADQVSIRLLHAVAEGKRTIQMHLHPAELGSIDVKMQWQGDRLTAQFQVDRPETLVLLQRDVPALERTLNQAGVNVDSGSLSFSLRQQTGNGQNSSNGQPFDPAAAGAAFGEATDLPLGDEPLGQVIRDGILSIRV
jgi:hypothetical protein